MGPRMVIGAEVVVSCGIYIEVQCNAIDCTTGPRWCAAGWLGSTLSNQRLPQGWSVLNGMPYCSDHRPVVHITGEE